MSSEVDIVNLIKCHLEDEEGRRVPIHTLWKDQTAIFIYLRHFACIDCRAHAKEVWNQKEQYQAKGANIYFVGNGAARYIKTFKEDLGLQKALVFTDPSLDSFKSAGFKKGFLKCLGPQSLFKAAQMYKAGHRQSKYKKDMGDLWQLGGTLAINTEGKTLYHKISEKLGDYSPENDIPRMS